MPLTVMDWEDRFLPEAVLPCQYYKPNTELTPLARLMLGVLTKAWGDVQQLTPRTPLQRREELREWFFGTWDGPFSFQTICEVLNIDIGEARKVIASCALWPARRTSGKRVLTPVCVAGHTLRQTGMVSTKYGRKCRECYTLKHPNFTTNKRISVK